MSSVSIAPANRRGIHAFGVFDLFAAGMWMVIGLGVFFVSFLAVTAYFFALLLALGAIPFALAGSRLLAGKSPHAAVQLLAFAVVCGFAFYVKAMVVEWDAVSALDPVTLVVTHVPLFIALGGLAEIIYVKRRF